MALSKHKLGELIETCDVRNFDDRLTLDDVRGISTGKEFIKTKADMDGVSLSSYKVVDTGEFAYVADTSRRGEKVALSFNKSAQSYLISSIYTVFRVSRKDLILSDYLFVFFNRPEFDRYARFNSWGSAREAFSWEDMCDIDIELPDLATQQKYVDIYNAMVANQQSYEHGLEDLKLVCDSYFDDAKRKNTVLLRTLIESVDIRNSDNAYSDKDVKGITNNKEFAQTKADISAVDLSKFKIVQPKHFAYNSRTDGRDMLVLALNRTEQTFIVTFNYNVFKVKDSKNDIIDPEYLYAFFKRLEFDRKVRFHSWGSSQELLSWDNLCDFEIPAPDFYELHSIAQIMKSYIERKEINEQLKAQIKNLCPILIRGSLEEGKL